MRMYVPSEDTHRPKITGFHKHFNTKVSNSSLYIAHKVLQCITAGTKHYILHNNDLPINSILERIQTHVTNVNMLYC